MNVYSGRTRHYESLVFFQCEIYRDRCLDESQVMKMTPAVTAVATMMWSVEPQTHAARVEIDVTHVSSSDENR